MTAPPDLAATVGRTPLVALRRLVPAGSARVLVTLASHTPTGRRTDRTALAVVKGV